MGRTTKFFAALSALAASSALAAEPAPLSPVSPWQSRSDENRCRVSRVFGEEGNRHLVILEQFSPTGGVSLTVAGPAVAPLVSGELGSLTVSDGVSTSEAVAVRAAAPLVGPAVVLGEVPLGRDRAAGVQRGAELGLAGSGQEVRFRTGPLADALTTLDTCAEGLATGWGFKAAELGTATQPPQWVNREMLLTAVEESFGSERQRRQGPQGIAQLRVVVDAAGKVEDCEVVSVTTTLYPNQQACRVMRKALFQPARDDAGKPQRSIYTASFIDYRRFNRLSWGFDPTGVARPQY